MKKAPYTYECRTKLPDARFVPLQPQEPPPADGFAIVEGICAAIIGIAICLIIGMIFATIISYL